MNIVKRKYESARANLLLVIIITAVNIALILLDTGRSFLFSASLPQIFVVIGVAFGAMWELPALTAIGIVHGVLTLGVYLLCYFLSKKKSGWMIFALVWFIVDWIAMILGFLVLFEVNFGVILDLVFHVWITIYLVSGVKYAKEYCENEMYNKTLIPPAVTQAALEKTEHAEETAPLRAAENVRGRKTLIAAEYNGMRVRVDNLKGKTELIVNDFVYAEYNALMKGNIFSISAIVSGVQYVVVSEQRRLYSVRELYADGALMGQKKKF